MEEKVKKEFKCEKCGYTWKSRIKAGGLPKRCPNQECQSPFWNNPEKLKEISRTRSRAQDRLKQLGNLQAKSKGERVPE